MVVKRGARCLLSMCARVAHEMLRSQRGSLQFIVSGYYCVDFSRVFLCAWVRARGSGPGLRAPGPGPGAMAPGPGPGIRARAGAGLCSRGASEINADYRLKEDIGEISIFSTLVL